MHTHLYLNTRLVERRRRELLAEAARGSRLAAASGHPGDGLALAYAIGATVLVLALLFAGWLLGGATLAALVG